jgi:hypothetical protein
MRSTSRLARLLGAAVIASALTVATAGAAFAAAPASAPAHAAASAPAAATSPGHVQAPPPGAPSGCNNNNFCSYNQGNGGSLCFQTSVNVQAWPGPCANHNDSAYNRNGNSVNLYYYAYYDGAYATLYSGNYWLYMSRNYFTNCSNNCDGLHEAMQNNVASSHFN